MYWLQLFYHLEFLQLKIERSEKRTTYITLLAYDWLWFGWLVLICIWNFVWPEVPPIADVVVAVVLSLGVITIKKRKK